MDINGKIWGETSKIFSKNNIEIFRIHGKAAGKSSMHMHEHKYSMFFVEKGKIKVTIEKNDYDLIDITELGTHQSMIIRPKEYHCFEVIDDNSICYEIYWTELNTNDIIRKDCGSIGT